jgi:hypothetical protein
MGEIMQKPLQHFALAALLGMFSFPTSAAIINLTASIDGNQEVPPTGSLATGTGTMLYDDVTNLLNWDITYSAGSMVGTPTVSHFHGPAPVGSNAGVQVDIVANSGGSIASPMIGSATITNAQEADLLAGLWYINIHSTAFPGGEIRGQVNVVPIPAAVWLFGSGLIGLIGIARRKKA